MSRRAVESNLIRAPRRNAVLMLFVLSFEIVTVQGAENIVKQISVTTHAFEPGVATQVNLPYFDDNNRLHWSEEKLPSAPADICPTPSLVTSVLASPHIDEWRCGNGQRYIVALGPSGVLWKRLLSHHSGPFEISLSVIGANESGLVLSSLEVLSPTTGVTIRKPPLKEFVQEKRSVPLFSLTGAGTVRSHGEAYFVTANVGAFAGATDGLYQIDNVVNKQVLLQMPQRSRLAPITIEDIQIDRSERYLLLAENWAYRGPNWVRFSIYDLVARKVVYEALHGKGNSVNQPRVFIGRDGHLVFFYRNASTRQYVIVHYRFLAPHI